MPEHFEDMPPRPEQEAAEQEDIEQLEIRVERLGIAIDKDPEAFRALVEGLADSMQENSIDMLGDSIDREEMQQSAEDFHVGALLKQLAPYVPNIATYAAGM